MSNKNRKYFRLFLTVTICAAIAILTIKHFTKGPKSETLSRLISNLEKYKSKKDNYPVDLRTSKIKCATWVYYSTDSIQDSFSLAYTEGILNVNTIFYDSKKGEWEKRFNY